MILKKIIKKTKYFLPNFYLLCGAFILSSGWNWYHSPHNPHLKFFINFITIWLVVFVSYKVFVLIYKKLVKKFNKINFWSSDFVLALDEMFLIGSLAFLIFFFKSEILSVSYAFFVILLFFWRLGLFLKKHPRASDWKIVHDSFFSFAIFIFVLTAFFQYVAYKYFILDVNSSVFNIVFFRSWVMTFFWLAGFSVSILAWIYFKKFFKYLLFIILSAIFVMSIFLWFSNLEILYYSGLYVSPVALEHAQGGGQLIWQWFTFFIFLSSFVFSVIFIILSKKLLKAIKNTPKKYSVFYLSSIIFVAVVSIFALSTFKNTPEYYIVKSFYDYYIKGVDETVELKPIVQEKLKRFGLSYNLDEFYVGQKDNVFKEEKQLLPEKFKNNTPNIIIVFFESFSARLTDVYDSNIYPGLTPNLKDMSENENTTIFRKYYNGSTPTITGLISQLCSILPPTGHGEITQENKYRSHRLLCLPEILERQAGFKYTNYITAVRSDFAHKDTIFKSMGTDEVWGRDELYDYLEGPPLSWGWSDHQMMPLLLQFAREKQDPFLLMLSTVDSHPPYNLTKDIVKYKDLGSDMVDTVHTSDDAFGSFWEEFKSSEFYDNTIVIAVADHAMFPGAYTKEYFPDLYTKMNFYDENLFMMYIPDSVLPKEVDMYSSGIDFTPTLLHVLDINIPNAFDGHSIFDDRIQYPNLLGMHELGLYIDEELPTGTRVRDYSVPDYIKCDATHFNGDVEDPLTLCEYLNYYNWKRTAFAQGRFWKN